MKTTVQFTRADYMAKRCSHREYYAQFVDVSVKHRVLQVISKKEIMDSKCEHFNDIALARWDKVLIPVPADAARKIRESGDYPTLSGAVCIAKEAARQIAEE